jgi:hypothetical protein
MKVFSLILGVLLASIFWSAAQVSVEVVLDQEQFLLDESLPVKVRITNRSGQTLKLGQEPDWLTFTIQSRDGFVVAASREVPVPGEQIVESSMVASRRVDLMPYYDLSKPGRYTVAAKVSIKQWHDEIVSKPKPFEISRGTTIWEQEFGVPAAGGVPEPRKYALQQAGYLKRMMLYVRLTDLGGNKVFKVFPAGPLLSFSKPEAQVDRASDLHLLFQTGARSFLYQVINPEGDVLVRQTYDYTSTRPVLRSGEDGKTLVVGGIRRATSNDLPAPAAPTSTNDINSPKS